MFLRKAILFTFIVFLGFPVYAIDYQKYKLTMVSKDEKIFFDEIKTYLTLKTPEDQTIQIIHSGEMTDALLERILRLKESFDSWQSIKIKSVQFIVHKDSIDFVIVLSRFNHQNKDYLPFVPTGMSFFTQNEKIFYDFRILKDTVSHKFSGVLENEKSFLDKFLIYINEKKPEEFLKKQEEMKNKPKEEPKKKEETQDSPFLYEQSIKVFAGTGTLFGVGYSRVFFNFLEPMIFTGFVYYESTEPNGDKVKKMSIPGGLRLNALILRSSLFQPYIFAGGQYNPNIQNYESRTIFFGGIGQTVFKYAFIEVSYMYSKNWDGFVIGFGAQLPF